jgi:hypothetical protein
VACHKTDFLEFYLARNKVLNTQAFSTSAIVALFPTNVNLPEIGKNI